MSPLNPEQITRYKARVPSAVEREPMLKHTTVRMGGEARLYVVAGSSDALVQAVDAAIELGLPYYIFGGGSNLLVSDDGFEGVMIQAANRALRIEGSRVFAEAGMITALVARTSVEKGLGGFEWAVGVPGTIGGALYGNAGCYGAEMKDNVESVDVYRLRDRARLTLMNVECDYGYRESLFKRESHIILGCVLQLAPSPDPVASKARLEEIMKQRKESQPLDQSSAGCMFKNFEYQDEQDLKKLQAIADIPLEMLRAKRLAAGWLIEQANLKGTVVGGMMVSEKHGNFLVNRGKGSASDVIALVSLVKQRVRDAFGIQLQEEVQLVGF